jgi:hypothetical protein
MNFKEFVASVASDEEVGRRIRENATQKDRKAIIKWNNEMRCLRLCELSEQVQEYFETYVPQFCHPASKVKFFSTFTTWKKESSNPNAVELVVLFQQIRSFP